MQTSSISLAAAAALTVASLNSATAGGWIVSGRPNFVPPMRMVAPPMHPASGRFFPMGHVGFFHQGPGPGTPFSRFGRGPFFPSGFASFGYAPAPAAPGPYLVSVGEPSARPIIWAPVNVSVIAPGPGCVDDESPLAATGGPKIITLGEPPPSDHPEKMPVVIYGTQSRGGC
ncbi:MAG: hypothetical protein ACLQE9_13000 [Roseiarcus sp.]